MNAALRAVVRQGIYMGDQVFGIRRGYQGLLDRDRIRLRLNSVADIIKAGGTFLRTARSAEFREAEAQERAIGQLSEWGVDGLVVIGGDGSLQGAYSLHAMGFPVVGIPASIDNDIFGTEETIGFDTAVNNVAHSMDQIRDTASAHDRVFVIEVMGRHSGAIALAAGLAGGAESIVIPEIPVHYDRIVDRLRASTARGKRHSLIVVAEGAGPGAKVAETIRNLTGFDVRLTVLGHTQRGGPPSARDRILGSLLGTEAIRALKEGESGVMVGMQAGSVVRVPLERVMARPKTADMDIAHLIAILSI